MSRNSSLWCDTRCIKRECVRDATPRILAYGSLPGYRLDSGSYLMMHSFCLDAQRYFEKSSSLGGTRGSSVSANATRGSLR